MLLPVKRPRGYQDTAVGHDEFFVPLLVETRELLDG